MLNPPFSTWIWFMLIHSKTDIKSIDWKKSKFTFYAKHQNFLGVKYLFVENDMIYSFLFSWTSKECYVSIIFFFFNLPLTSKEYTKTVYLYVKIPLYRVPWFPSKWKNIPKNTFRVCFTNFFVRMDSYETKITFYRWFHWTISFGRYLIEAFS